MNKMTKKTARVLLERIEAIAKWEYGEGITCGDDFRVDDYADEIFEGLEFEEIDKRVSDMPIEEWLEDYYCSCIEALEDLGKMKEIVSVKRKDCLKNNITCKGKEERNEKTEQN